MICWNNVLLSKNFLMKIKNLKYILWALPLFILFFINWFLFAADSVSDPSQCSGIPNHSTDPANNQNNVNESGWYYNDIQGLERYYQKNNIWLNEVMMGVINHRWALFSVFDSQADLVWADKIWHLQNAINAAECGHINTDCRLWRDTSQAFFNFSCDICTKIDSSYVDMTYNNPFVCRDGYEEVEVSTPKGTTLCCKPSINIEFSAINIVETQWEYWNLHVDISSSLEDAEEYGFDVNVNEITATNAEWQNLSNISIVWPTDVTSNTVRQSVSIQASTWSAVTVNVNAWFFQALDLDDNIVAESPSGSETFTPEEEPEEEWGPEPEEEWDDNCDDLWENYYYDPNMQTCIQCEKPLINDSCESYWWSWILNDLWTCCKEGGSCQHPTDENWSCWDGMVIDPNLNNCCMACNNLPQNWGCQQWFVLQNNCCLDAWNCQSWYYDTNTQCIQCTWDTMPNEAHTRCICDPDKKCCGVQLNNVVPFIWDCIEMNAESSRDNTTNVNSVTAFPILMQWLMKILMSVIMIFSFLMIIVAWLMIVSWAFGWNWFATGKKIIKNVIISLILLWCSWLILSLINPSFFGG